MTQRFAQDLKKFYEHNEKAFHPAVISAAKHYDESFKAVCADVDHLSENTHMLRVCCPPMRPLPDDASPELRTAFQEHVNHCYRANVGWGYDRSATTFADRQRAAYESKRHQKLVEIVSSVACMDVDFNRSHIDVCCSTPGLVLGWTNDNEPVARVCGTARQ